VRLLIALRTVGNPDHGGAESREVVFLCIVRARRELPLLPLGVVDLLQLRGEVTVRGQLACRGGGTEPVHLPGGTRRHRARPMGRGGIPAGLAARRVSPRHAAAGRTGVLPRRLRLGGRRPKPRWARPPGRSAQGSCSGWRRSSCTGGGSMTLASMPAAGWRWHAPTRTRSARAGGPTCSPRSSTSLATSTPPP